MQCLCLDNLVVLQRFFNIFLIKMQGLGKTVQAISLLCALYGKTGTGLDFLEITRRWKLVKERKVAAQRERENAMLNGNMFVQQDIDLSGLNLPPVYPVLLIVPPSLVDK